jgi:DNA polymerase, archaea type
MTYNKLLHGKNDKENIVSIEIDEASAEIFTERDGKISSEFIKNKFWILAHEKLDKFFVKMKGDLHYGWGRQVEERGHFFILRNIYKSKDIFSIYDSKEALMVKDGYTYFKGMRLKDVSVLSFDIETTSLELNDSAKVLLISNTYRNGNGKIIKKLFSYKDYPDDNAFFTDWCNWVLDINPSVILGHNIFSYDLPYLHYCASRAGCSLLLGRDKSGIRFDSFESKKRKDQTQNVNYRRAHIYGREIVDTLFLAIDYDIATKKYESYGLKAIIKTENLEKKDRVFYDASTIRKNYTIPEEWDKIKLYCIDDSDDALALYDLMAPSFFYTSQNIPKSYQSVCYSASGSKINSIMIRAYLQDGHSLPKASEAKRFEGAISIGNPGIYSNVFKVDVASLYPSILIHYGVYDGEKDPKAYFKELVSTFTEKRLEYKKKAKEDKYFDDLQQSYKIFINSCYGFLGATGLLFNSPYYASFVTEKGREILNKTIAWAEDQQLRIVNADTDSISFCSADQSPISESSQLLFLEDLNSNFPSRIRFENDGYYKKVIVLKAKNYILFDGKKIKYKGSAIKASTKEPALKEFIKRIIDSIMNDANSYTEIYNQYVNEIKDVKDIKRWVYRRALTNTVFSSTRTNETKVVDAIKGTEYTEGDRVYLFFKPDGSLALVEHFNGDYDKKRLLHKLFETTKVFETVLPVDELFPNYKLKKNQEKLEKVQ